MYNEKYIKGMEGKMSRLEDGKHASEVMKCDPFKAQYELNKGLQNKPRGSRGYPQQAWDYKY
jgi:hypothetical protein